MTNVESSQNTNLDRFRATLNQQIPELNDHIKDCIGDINDPMFLEETPMHEAIHKLDGIEGAF